MTNFNSLYNEAITVSNAAEAFADPVDFESTNIFVKNVQKVQKKLIEYIVSSVEENVIQAASSKYIDIFKFKGSELFEDYNIPFMMFGTPFMLFEEAERREQLDKYGFQGCFDELGKRLSPFYLKHSWDRATNDHIITLFWK